MVRFLFAVGCLVLFSNSQAKADDLLWADREDPSVPAHCRDPQLRSFGTVERKVFYGITGAVSKGFTHEIEIARNDASLLWEALKTGHGVVARLQGALNFLEGSRISKGYEFEREGDVLEAFALADLEREYPEAQYYTTGGISYHNHAPGGHFETLGEVDVVVARRADCSVVAIGEAKLGVKALNHAREQVSRFVKYVKNGLCSSKATYPICSLN